MQVIEGDNAIYFDVDNTLIMWNPDPMDPNNMWIPSLKTGELVQLLPHKKHIDLLKHHARVGNTVIVWSKSGPQWAKHIVEQLYLTTYVDLVVGKPSCFYDDLKPEQFMGSHRYFDN